MLLAISAIVGRFLCCGYICALGVEKVGAPWGRVLWLPAFAARVNVFETPRSIIY